MHTIPQFQLVKDDLRLLEDAIHHAPQPELRQRAVAIRLLHLGYSIDQISSILAETPTTIRRWRRAWCKGGIFALRDPEPTSKNPDTFLGRLTALQKISLELTTASSLDDLCRQG